MKLTVKMLATGQVMELDDLPQDITVLDTKKRIERLEGSLASSQRLIFGGKTLKDDRTLQDCGIQKEALVHVVLRLKNSLTVSIRTMTGKTITLEVKPSDTVHGVKAMIEEIVQIPANKHTLNFAGQRLANHRALSDCGIMDKSTLRLILEPLSVGPGTQEIVFERVPAEVPHKKQRSGMFETLFGVARGMISSRSEG